MRGKEVMAYYPNIKRKKNEDLADYKIRQLDYWLKHTCRIPKPFWRRWFSKDKLEIAWFDII